MKNLFLIRLPALRSLDLGIDYFHVRWCITTTIAPLTYLRLDLRCIDVLIDLLSTPPLFNTLRQLDVKIGNSHADIPSEKSVSDLRIRMVNLHTFTLVQNFFSMLKIEWTSFEILTSSNMMPVFRHANVSIFITTADLNRISSSSLFTDHRHVDVQFVVHLSNCPQYMKVTQFIPRGSHFHSQEIVGATFVVNHWSDKSQQLIHDDPFTSGHQYHHHMWYTVPWKFDEFFHEYIPYKWITKTYVFERPKKITNNRSSLRTFDASGQTLSSFLSSLPYVALSDCIETLHLSFYNKPLYIHLSNLRNLTLVNSINCLNRYSSLPTTIRCVRILLFYCYPNYMSPNWPMILLALSALHQLSSLRIFMYDMPQAFDDESCQMIAKTAPLFNDFGFFFRRKCGLFNYDQLEKGFEENIIFIQNLSYYILLFSTDKQLCYSIEDDGCGLIKWF